MARRSGLIALADGVRAYFQSQSIDAVVARVSRRGREQWITQAPRGANRVLFMQPPDGARGRLRRGQKSNFNPEVIAEWDRPVILSVWAADPGASSDEEAQMGATEDLLEIALQAMRRAVDPVTDQPIGYSNIELGEMREVTDDKELYFGVELQLGFVIKMPLFDVTYDTTTPKAQIHKPQHMTAPVGGPYVGTTPQ